MDGNLCLIGRQERKSNKEIKCHGKITMFKIHKMLMLEILMNLQSNKMRKNLRSQVKISLSDANNTPALVLGGTTGAPLAPPL